MLKKWKEQIEKETVGEDTSFALLDATFNSDAEDMQCTPQHSDNVIERGTSRGDTLKETG